MAEAETFEDLKKKSDAYKVRGKELMPNFRKTGSDMLSIMGHAVAEAMQRQSREDVAAVVLTSMHDIAKLAATAMSILRPIAGDGVEDLFVAICGEHIEKLSTIKSPFEKNQEDTNAPIH